VKLRLSLVRINGRCVPPPPCAFLLGTTGGSKSNNNNTWISKEGSYRYVVWSDNRNETYYHTPCTQYVQYIRRRLARCSCLLCNLQRRSGPGRAAYVRTHTAHRQSAVITYHHTVRTRPAGPLSLSQMCCGPRSCEWSDPYVSNLAWSQDICMCVSSVARELLDRHRLFHAVERTRGPLM
jgi:hypothetical protein